MNSHLGDLSSVMYDVMKKFDCVHIIPIEKGWSVDKKFQVTDSDGTKNLLRIMPMERYKDIAKLFAVLDEVERTNISMCKPVDFGICGDEVYTLYTWIEGIDAQEIVPTMSCEEQYTLGFESGKILNKIHSIPAPDNQEDWYTRFNRKTNNKIAKYKECPLKFSGDDRIIEYIESNRELLRNRPQCFQHGDYHIGNMMVENGKVVVIDFERFDFGDPWEEFNRIVFTAQVSPLFASGMVNGYFSNNVPMNFWRLLAFYISSNTFSSIYWAIPFGQEEVDFMVKQSQDILSWYDNMRNPVPTWYKMPTK